MSVSIAPVAKEGRDEASRWHDLVPLEIYITGTCIYQGMPMVGQNKIC